MLSATPTAADPARTLRPRGAAVPGLATDYSAEPWCERLNGTSTRSSEAASRMDRTPVARLGSQQRLRPEPEPVPAPAGTHGRTAGRRGRDTATGRDLRRAVAHGRSAGPGAVDDRGADLRPEAPGRHHGHGRDRTPPPAEQPESGVAGRRQADTAGGSHALRPDRTDGRGDRGTRSHVVAISPTWNASAGAVGLRRQRVLELGLPFWLVLAPQNASRCWATSWATS